MTEWEEGAGVTPLDVLHAQRHTLITDSSRIAGWYGNFGSWDAHRKSMLSLCAMRVRLDFEGQKITEAQVDDRAHAHPEYVAFLARTDGERAAWIITQDTINGINERIKRDDHALWSRRGDMGASGR